MNSLNKLFATLLILLSALTPVTSSGQQLVNSYYADTDYPELTSVLSYAATNAYYQPSPQTLAALNTFIAGLKSNGVWSDISRLYITDVDGDANFASIEYTNPGSGTSLLRASNPLHRRNVGFDGNGLNTYLNTQFIPSADGVNWLQDEMGFVLGLKENISETGYVIGSISNSTTRFFQYRPRNSAQLLGAFNGSTGFVVNSITTSLGTHHGQRVAASGAGASKVFRDGSSVGTGTDASNGLSSNPIYVLAQNQNGSATGYSSNTVGLIMLGKSFTGKESIINTLYNTYKSSLPAYTAPPGKIDLSGTNITRIFGDSMSAGVGVSDGSKMYYRRLETLLTGFTEFAYVASGRGIWYAVDQAMPLSYTKQVNHMNVMIGLNDILRNGAASKTIAKIKGGYMTLAAKHFEKSRVAFGSSSVTRTGTFTNVSARALGGYYGSVAIPGNTAVENTTAATLSYGFTDTNVCVQLIGNSGDVETYGSIEVYIDNVLTETIDTNVLYDNVTDTHYDNRRGPITYCYTGLTNAAHTLRIETLGTGKVILDAAVILDAPANCGTVIFQEIPYCTPAGYAGSPGLNSGSIAATNTANAAIEDVVEVFEPLGYRIKMGRTNSFYNPVNTTDGVHANDDGHAQIYNSTREVVQF